MTVKQWVFQGYLMGVERLLKNALRDGPKNGWWHIKLDIALREVQGVLADARKGIDEPLRDMH